MMRRFLSRHAALLTAMCCAFVGKVEAQRINGVQPRTRIRVETLNGTLSEGRVTQIRNDSVWVRVDRATSETLFPAGSLRSYEISLGAARGTGAKRGALIAGALGLIAVTLVLRDDMRSHDRIVPSTLFVAPAAVLGTLVGAGIGAIIAQERWTSPIRIGALPPSTGNGHLSIAYNIKF